MLEHLNLFLCCFRVEMSHVGEEYERTDTYTDNKDDTEADKERDRSDSPSIVSWASTEEGVEEEEASRCRDRCPACERLFRLVGPPPPPPAMDRLSLGTQHLSGLLVEVEFGVRELAAILPRAEKRFPGRFLDAASLRATTTGTSETVEEENVNNASDSCEFEEEADDVDQIRHLETIRRKIARLNSHLEAKNQEILLQAACVPELRFYSRDLVRILDVCHAQIARYGLMTDPAYSWIMNRCGGESPSPCPVFFDRGYGLDALNFYRQRLEVLHARFTERHGERVRRYEAAGLRFVRDAVEARRRFIWRLEEYFSSPPGYRPPSPPPSDRRSCSELSNVCENSSSVMADMSIYQQ